MSYEPPIHDPRHDEDFYREQAEGSRSGATCSAVPEDVAREIRDTWKAAREAGGELQAFRIIERMVDRLGYGRTENNPPLLPNH